jgi:tRNA dimethylallyltransferase
MEPELNIPPQGHVPSLRPQVLVLAGATSVGKSAVSMELCKKLNAEIVIADSVQVYQGLDIGANKPTLEDQQAVPHHLIDICEPNHQMNTAEFCEEALRAIADITSRNKTAIVVGGSTMWIQWLVHGKPDAPKASEFAIQRAKHMLDHFELEKRWEDGLDILKSLDGERAARLPKNDWYRLRRYLEIAIDLNEGGVNCSYSDEEGNLNNSKRLTGKRQSFLKDFDVRCFFLMEAREQLYHTIDCRCELMLKAGLLEEVFRLLSSGKLHPSFPISRSIGYRQVIEYFCRDINENDMTAFQEFLR